MAKKKAARQPKTSSNALDKLEALAKLKRGKVKIKKPKAKKASDVYVA